MENEGQDRWRGVDTTVVGNPEMVRRLAAGVGDLAVTYTHVKHQVSQAGVLAESSDGTDLVAALLIWQQVGSATRAAREDLQRLGRDLAAHLARMAGSPVVASLGRMLDKYEAELASIAAAADGQVRALREHGVDETLMQVLASDVAELDRVQRELLAIRNEGLGEIADLYSGARQRFYASAMSRADAAVAVGELTRVRDMCAALRADVGTLRRDAVAASELPALRTGLLAVFHDCDDAMGEFERKADELIGIARGDGITADARRAADLKPNPLVRPRAPDRGDDHQRRSPYVR